VGVVWNSLREIPSGYSEKRPFGSSNVTLRIGSA
jgi:hypothetical protein